MSEWIDPEAVDAVVFDLDGVVTDTAAVHAHAWKELFDEFLESRDGASASDDEDLSPFTDQDYRREVDGMPRRDGIRSFLASRGIEVDGATVEELAERKDAYFHERLDRDGVAVFGSTVRLVHRLHLHGLATAVFSSSRNAGPVLGRAGLEGLFEVRVDGRTAEELDLPGKPDPAVPLEAASRLGAEPPRTVLVEDAEAGVEAGRRGGFGRVVGVDRHGDPEPLRRHGADVVVADLAEMGVEGLLRPLSQVPAATDAWDAVAGLLEGQRIVVFLDFDGTLAPIVDDPDAAAAPAATMDVVERLARSCTVAVVSGRGLDDLRSRIDLPGLWLAGSHGFEVEGPDGVEHPLQEVRDALPALDDATGRLRDEFGDLPGVHVERKRFAIAVHTRRADADATEQVRQQVERVGAACGLRATGGREVVELRPDVEWDKGAALRWILDRVGQDGDARPTLPVYAGDDLTDEDALRVVGPGGLGIVVANDEHGDRDTSAHVSVGGTEQLRDVLARMADALGAD